MKGKDNNNKTKEKNKTSLKKIQIEDEGDTVMLLDDYVEVKIENDRIVTENAANKFRNKKKENYKGKIFLIKNFLFN